MSTTEIIFDAPVIHPTRRRGRPKNDRPKIDTGTPELIFKRLKGETAEALDLCLDRNIITQQQHWCGIHLRWLYTIKYGAPGVRAIDPTHFGGMEIRSENLEWRIEREKEYHEAIKNLTQRGHASGIIDLCIFNERPAFLNIHRAVSEKSALKLIKKIEDICAGLEILVKYWICHYSIPDNR